MLKLTLPIAVASLILRSTMTHPLRITPQAPAHEVRPSEATVLCLVMCFHFLKTLYETHNMRRVPSAKTRQQHLPKTR